jgi:hypothetical protein
MTTINKFTEKEIMEQSHPQQLKKNLTSKFHQGSERSLQ